LYIGHMYIGNIAGLAARLPARLPIGSTAGIVGVADCAGALRAVLTVPVDWFKTFLAFNCLVRALI